MTIYYSLMLYWFIISIIMQTRKTQINSMKRIAISSWIPLFLIMGLKHFSVGGDWRQYLYRYNNNILDFKAWNGEWLYNAFVSFLKTIGVGNQGYIAIMALIFSTGFVYFFYKYSKNIILSLYLHLTIGLFTMSMSGIRQTLAAIIILYAFSFLVSEKNTIFNFIKYSSIIVTAYFIHNSALVFLPVYLLRNIKITKKNGVVFILVSTSLALFRKQVLPIIAYFIPERYDSRYELLSSANPVNPLLIIIAILIPIACILIWNKMDIKDEIKHRLFSVLFILSCINIAMNVLSLNSNIFGRLAFYFVTFNMVLIPNVIVGIKDKRLRIIAYYLSIILPLIQFSISTPGGTLGIDKYLFFWQSQ